VRSPSPGLCKILPELG